jgi:hypothetical protein
MSRQREILRALRHLCAAAAQASTEVGGGWRIENGGRRHSVPPDAAAEMLARGLAVASPSGILATASGRAALRRSLAGADGFQAQHQDRVAATLTEDGESRPVTVNPDESPLASLRRRKGRDGRPLIDAIQFSAGERLRADAERGQMVPRITANWRASVASGRRAGGVAELTEAALSARIRVEKALAAVGPDFAGLLLDACCFLKGMEAIERERGWPVRSAKLALQLALNALARHYGLAAEARGAEARRLRHWGAADYRPKLG